MPIMSQEIEPSIQDYARYYGLAQDHRIPGPLESVLSLEEVTRSSSVEYLCGDINDPLEQCGCSPGQNLVQNGPFQCKICTGPRSDAFETGPAGERMFIDAATASLLAWVTRPTNTSPNFDDNNGLEALRCRRLKHAPPILHSDHESDLRDFVRPYEPDLRNEFLPFEVLDEEADEDFTWPSKYLELPNKIWEEMTRERLEVPAETLQYIAEVVKQGACDGSKRTFEIDKQSELPYKRVRRLTAIYT